MRRIDSAENLPVRQHLEAMLLARLAEWRTAQSIQGTPARAAQPAKHPWPAHVQHTSKAAQVVHTPSFIGAECFMP
jgi:hypothetical protein